MDGTVCGRWGSPASIDFAPATLGPLAAQALLSGNSWIRPGGSALASASMAAAAVAVRAEIWLPSEPGPDTGASARCPGAAVGTTAGGAARGGGGSGGGATRAAQPRTRPLSPPGLSAAAACPPAVAGLTAAGAATGAFAAAATGPLAAAGLAAAVVAVAVVRAWPAWGAMGDRPRYLYGPGS